MYISFYFRFLMEYLTGQLVYGMELVGKDAVAACIECLGDQDPLKAAPGTIRALYGTDPIRNCVHASSSADAALVVCIRLFVTFIDFLKSPKKVK